MDVHAYSYVGPDEIREAAASQPAGTPISSRDEAAAWLRAHPDALAEGATYVVDLDGRLLLAPRRSEHVACASGGEVLAAGEIRFRRTADAIDVVAVSNLSSGYCPDTSCWPAVERAIRLAGLPPPGSLSSEIIWRRCTSCQEKSLVKENWFVCVFCDAELPAGRNAGTRRSFVLATE